MENNWKTCVWAARQLQGSSQLLCNKGMSINVLYFLGTPGSSLHVVVAALVYQTGSGVPLQHHQPHVGRHPRDQQGGRSLVPQRALVNLLVEIPEILRLRKVALTVEPGWLARRAWLRINILQNFIKYSGHQTRCQASCKASRTAA